MSPASTTACPCWPDRLFCMVLLLYTGAAVPVYAKVVLGLALNVNDLKIASTVYPVISTLIEVGIAPFITATIVTLDVVKPGAIGSPVPAELPYTTTFFTAVANVADG